MKYKQGMTPELAAFLGQPAGKSFHFVLNNTVVKDNRIPPRGVQQLDYDRPGLRPVGAVYADGQYWDETLFTVPASTERCSGHALLPDGFKRIYRLPAWSGGC